MNWVVPTDMWKDQEVWIIGGGPSVSRQFQVPQEIIEKVENGEHPISALSPYMKAIHDKPVIGVNMAFLLGPWIDMAFWGDPSFYRKKGVQEQLLNFPNLKIGAHQWFNDKKMERQGIKAIAREKERAGLSDNPAKIRWNWNSGACAINIAVNAGAKRIILVGFDMHSIPSHSHWHNGYGHPKTPPYKTHLGGFKQIALDAKRRGVEIINACPDSAIPHFPKANVSDLINMKKDYVVVDTDIERSQGVLKKYKTLEKIQSIIRPQFYVEIGVGRGNSLLCSKAAYSIGIDPKPRVIKKLPTNVQIVKEKADTFFQSADIDPIDLAFIDGSHLIENVLSDFINIESRSKRDSVILLDDVAPAHPIQANRIKQSIKWAGDVWKIIPILKKYRPDLDLKLLDVNPTGMLMVSNLDPSNTVLERNSKKILNEWKNEVMPMEVLLRKEVYSNLDFLQYEKKEHLKIGIITPTCSPERKPFIDFLKQRMQEQTRQPNEWYVIDYPNETNKPDLAKRYKQGISKALEDGCDFILFMEDDDYYPKTYIEDMVDGWIEAGQPDVFGVDETIYCHLDNGKFRFFSKKNHCSAFCTGVGKNVNYRNVCADDVIHFDIRLWKHNSNSAKISLNAKRKPIGIKHSFGKGAGVFHDVKRFSDDSLALKDFVDEEALHFYKNLK